ncbi:MAG: glycosyltransferase involved in cell wall biosynthesis [Candidatus Azotimanducaceae bacterium]|jgi:glycosyltransferase involved in cell wall biosynthesis
MPKVKISVVVPVYNEDRYLRQCIGSVIGQSLKDIEIIVVNDASTDSSGTILKEYEESDNRVKVFDVATRGGVSAARNVGIEHAAGDYIIFLDGDDFWVAQGMLQDLYDRCVKEQLDILEFGLYRSADESEKPRKLSGQSRFVLLRQQIDWRVSYNVNTKLISRNMLRANQLRFDAELIVGEDALFSIQLYCRAERLAIYDRTYYFYRSNPQSVTGLGWDSAKLFCTVRWFELGIGAVHDGMSLDQRGHVLQLITNERLQKLLHRLGPIALDILDQQALSDYLACWSRCVAAIDCEEVAKVERDLLLAGDARLPKSLLDAVRCNDVDEFRAFFESHAYQRDKIHSPGKVTLKRDQALRIAKSILLANGHSIRCEFGEGIFVTLPRTKAHQLAAQLQANRQPTITLQFEL